MTAKLDLPPPPVTAGRGGGDSRWVELIRARDDIDAHLLTGRLNEAGIETRTMKDRAAPGAWLYGGSNPWAPVMVLVRRFQLEDARLELAELSFTGPAAEPSGEEDATSSRWSVPLVWWIVALVLGALLTGVALMKTTESNGRCELPLLCVGTL